MIIFWVLLAITVVSFLGYALLLFIAGGTGRKFKGWQVITIVSFAVLFAYLCMMFISRCTGVTRLTGHNTLQAVVHSVEKVDGALAVEVAKSNAWLLNVKRIRSNKWSNWLQTPLVEMAKVIHIENDY